ncbi:MAG: amidophosphoribosyltransferase [Erythrobacter sp. RIFCSPHIGHO2_12_FULL_63_10]|nr:MAG: amidophosphoribosyltransferase [Erythrobacter sp. RIFCSPHIGHO2_12_FULL_63_10]
MSWGSQISEGLRPLVDFIYPPRCPLCGCALARHGGLCVTCWTLLAIPGEPACASCGRPFGEVQTGKGTQCAPCLATPPIHAGIAAGVLYNDAARQLVLSFKHGGRIGLAPLLARLIAARLPEHGDGELALLVPVPLHRWRLWKRGYNQSALLARELKKLGKGELMVDLLQRPRQTPTLGGLGRKARRRALIGAIRLNPLRHDLVRGREVVLVDDVLTSGATSDACVRVLKKAGARSVRIACFARVLDEALDHASVAYEAD